ncbi:hypothetical protein MauCBS54593_000241 [Microsporum audouinii]
MSLSVEMVQGTEKSWIDLSKSSGKLAALYAIQNCGYIVLKAAANTGSIEEARDNEYTKALLSETRNGDFQPSHPGYIPAYRLKDPNIKMNRSRFWREQAMSRDPKELNYIMCYHLFGGSHDMWEWEYDKGLWEEETGETEVVQAAGGDLYVFCAGSKKTLTDCLSESSAMAGYPNDPQSRKGRKTLLL